MTSLPEPTRQGQLRVYVGFAPGVGKTYAMLDEAQRRMQRGTTVLVASVDCHNRPATQGRLDELVSLGCAHSQRFDVEEIVARGPGLVIVDDLAMVNPPAAIYHYRWQDVDALTAAGIDVIATLNIAHIESLSDRVREITGIEQHDVVPDDFLRRAHQVEIVDMSPEALRRRLAHGNVFPPDTFNAELNDFFQPQKLAALRELALLWLADRIEESLGQAPRFSVQRNSASNLPPLDDGGPFGQETPSVAQRSRAAISTLRGHTARRRVATLMAGAVLLGAVTAGELALKSRPSLSTTLLIFLGICVLMAALGGILVGSLAAVGAITIANYYFVAPVHTLRVGSIENVVDLIVFVSVTTTVSVLVNRTNQRSAEANRARAETEMLARSTAILGAERSPLPSLISHIRSTFSLDAVAVLESSNGNWHAVHSEGSPIPDQPDAAHSWPLNASGSLVLVISATHLDVESRRVLAVFADQLRVALAAREMQDVAAKSESIAQADNLRTALLRAVSHDLRTPLSTIKASVSSLLQTDIGWSDEDRDDFLTTIDSQTDHLNRLVGDLLDMSRLQGGALVIHPVATALEEVVGSAIAGLGHLDVKVILDVPDDLPFVDTDPVLLERALANVIHNAAQWSPPQHPVRVTAGHTTTGVQILVQDRGPGIPEAARSLVFEPFQRFGDQRSTGGVGLGLALSKGFMDAVGIVLHVEDTPGGGCTMVFDIATSATHATNEPGAL